MVNITESLILSFESKRSAEIHKIRGSNFGPKLRIFQLSDVEELKTTKYIMLWLVTTCTITTCTFMDFFKEFK